MCSNNSLYNVMWVNCWPYPNEFMAVTNTTRSMLPSLQSRLQYRLEVKGYIWKLTCHNHLGQGADSSLCNTQSSSESLPLHQFCCSLGSQDMTPLLPINKGSSLFEQAPELDQTCPINSLKQNVIIQKWIFLFYLEYSILFFLSIIYYFMKLILSLSSYESKELKRGVLGRVKTARSTLAGEHLHSCSKSNIWSDWL